MSPTAHPPAPTFVPHISPARTRDLLDGLLEHMLNGVAFCQMIYRDGRPYDYRYLYTNPAFHRQTGQGDVTGKLASEIRPGVRDSDQALLEAYGRVAHPGEPETFEMYIPSFGEWLSISVYCPLPDHFVALFDVITQRKRGELALEERATQLRFVLEGSELGFWDWNLATGRVERNARWAQMLGYTYEEIQTTAQQWSDFIHPDDRDRAWASIHAVVEGRAAAHKEEYRMRCKDGSYRWILDQAKVMARDDQGKALRMCGTHTDITERKLLEEELTRQAHIDYLTGVCNRRHFMARAEQELLRASRYATPLSLFMLDIDHFKRINDRYGHKVGDEVLKTLAGICQATLRQVDILGRLGGEEFAVLLPDSPPEAAREAAERLREAIARTKVPLEEGLPVQFTVSIGVAAPAGPDDNMDVLLNSADKALYCAKNGGRNRVWAS